MYIFTPKQTYYKQYLEFVAVVSSFSSTAFKTNKYSIFRQEAFHPFWQ